MATAPNSPYSASKAGSDLLALAYHRTHGLDVAVTRCSNNYGPYQFPEKVVPLFITHLIDGRTVPLYGDGSNIRDRLHVTDHCRGIDLVLHGGRAGEIYHIGGGTELSNHKLTGLLLDAVGAGWDRVEYVADRKGQDLRYSLDDGKIREHLGYAPQVAFTDGLAATVAGGSRSRRGRSCGDLVPAGDRCTRAAHPGRAGRAVRGGGHRRERHGRPTPRTRARTVAHSCCTSPPTTCSRERVVAELLPRTGYIVRTAWLYGAHGRNFVAIMLELAARRETLNVVADQHGQPTWSRALARQPAALGRAALARRAPAGIYHGTAAGRTTWYGLAREVFRRSGLDPERIRPVGSEKFPRPAVRPACGVLEHGNWARAGLVPLSRWDDQLTAALDTPAFAALTAAARTSGGHPSA